MPDQSPENSSRTPDLRVGLIIPSLDLGGAEKQLCLLARGLKDRNVDCHVVVLTRSGPREKALQGAGVPLHFIRKRWKVDPFALLRLKHCLQRMKPDVVHTWLFAANCYGRLAAKWANVRVIFGGERSIDPWKSAFHFQIDRFLARRSTGMITNSNGVREFYAEHGIPSSLFHVIPNGVPSFDGPPISREEACRRMKVPIDCHILMNIGRLWAQKGHADLLWIMEMIRVVRDDTKLVIIGDGPLRRRLELLRDQYRLGRDVMFLGERNDVEGLLPHATLLLHSSHYEGQPNSVLEAMRARVAVVATDIPGTRDIVVPNETGILVPLGDLKGFSKATLGLLDSPQRRAEFGAAGQRRIDEHFSVARMVDRHVELYRASRVQKSLP